MSKELFQCHKIDMLLRIILLHITHYFDLLLHINYYIISLL